MNFSGFRDKDSCRTLIAAIGKESTAPAVIMEVCGGHTMAIHRFGINTLLPSAIRLISGPGCPVCVSDIRYIDHLVALGRKENVTIATFGDLIRVPGSTSSLEKEKAAGADIRIVYSALDALRIAADEPDRKIVFPAIGFETTAPGSAAAVKEAHGSGLKNFFILSAHKIMPPAMAALIEEKVPIDAYLCPGHVSVITGSSIYEPIARNFGKSCVISGFEPTDILQSILMIVRQLNAKKPGVEIQYTRAVRSQGNPVAQRLLNEVFTLRDEYWRGLGIIPLSGMALKDDYSRYDAASINVSIEKAQEKKGCICGTILKGLASPAQCTLFAGACTPDHPVGACMVSSEGACAAGYAYAKHQ